MELHERVGAAVASVRRGDGPRFLECMTYRWRDHVGPTEDRVHKYRAGRRARRQDRGRQPEDRWRAAAGRDEAVHRSDRGEKRIADAIAFAEASTFPEDREVYDHVFTN